MRTRGLTHAAVAMITVMAVVLSLTLGATKARAQEMNPGVCPNGSKYYGRYYGEWAARWWKWAWSIPADRNPLLDTTGENAAEGQRGPVWFLAGMLAFGPGEYVVERTCTIPACKSLFFPILNSCYIAFPWDPPEEQDEEWMRAGRAEAMDTAENLSCEIDGEPVHNLQRYRVVSPVFYLAAGQCDLLHDLIPDLPDVRYGPCVDDGHYLMLPPLEVGDHIIHFHGEMYGGGFILDITYYLTVVGRGCAPRPGPRPPCR